MNPTPTGEKITMIITVNSQDLGDAGSIDTYNQFTGDGVDESIIQYYNENHNTNYTYDDFEWDYEHAEIVKDLATERAYLLETELPGFKSIKVESTGSPREYKFSTDYAMFEIDYDEKMVSDYINSHPEYVDWYRNSGWYSVIEWREDTEGKQELVRMAQLNFYLNDFYEEHWYDYDPLYDKESDIYWEHTRCKLNDEQVN